MFLFRILSKLAMTCLFPNLIFTSLHNRITLTLKRMPINMIFSTRTTKDKIFLSIFKTITNSTWIKRITGHLKRMSTIKARTMNYLKTSTQSKISNFQINRLTTFKTNYSTPIDNQTTLIRFSLTSKMFNCSQWTILNSQETTTNFNSTSKHLITLKMISSLKTITKII